jgi:hypothetical protein
MVCDIQARYRSQKFSTLISTPPTMKTPILVTLSAIPALAASPAEAPGAAVKPHPLIVTLDGSLLVARITPPKRKILHSDMVHIQRGL